jgi:uncharacterized protein YlxP (DUF503 family)
MMVRAVKITLYAPAARSLKDKRQILRSLIEKTKHKFNVAIAEASVCNQVSDLFIYRYEIIPMDVYKLMCTGL